MLGESEQERKDIRDKYIALGEKVELLLHQEERVKSNADRDTEAAKMAVKEAVSDLEMVCRPDHATASTESTSKQRVNECMSELWVWRCIMLTMVCFACNHSPMTQIAACGKSRHSTVPLQLHAVMQRNKPATCCISCTCLSPVLLLLR